VAPLHYWEIVLSLVAGGVFRGLAVGAATLAVSAIFVDLPMPHVFWLLLSWTVSSALFSAIGVIVGIIAESWDQISIISTFVLTPFIYLGGTFYSLDMIPDFWRKFTYFNPAFYCVDSTRYALLGIHQINPYYSLAIISVVTVLMIVVCTGLIKSGYKLIH
jgi:ABC-2 type transport system permease protein